MHSISPHLVLQSCFCNFTLSPSKPQMREGTIRLSLTGGIHRPSGPHGRAMPVTPSRQGGARAGGTAVLGPVPVPGLRRRIPLPLSFSFDISTPPYPLFGALHSVCMEQRPTLQKGQPSDMPQTFPPGDTRPSSFLYLSLGSSSGRNEPTQSLPCPSPILLVQKCFQNRLAVSRAVSRLEYETLTGLAPPSCRQYPFLL
jgi:hypothetical protein